MEFVILAAVRHAIRQAIDLYLIFGGNLGMLAQWDRRECAANTIHRVLRCGGEHFKVHQC